MSTGQRDEGFFSALFDFSFTSFVTTKLIKVIYILAMVGIALSALAIIIGGLVDGGANAFFGLVGGVLWFFLGILYVRVLLEFVIVVFRIGEHTATMARALTAGTGPSAPQVPWTPTAPAPPATAPSAPAPPAPAPPAQGWGPPSEPRAAEDPTRRLDEDPTSPLGDDRDRRPGGTGEVPPPPT